MAGPAAGASSPDAAPAGERPPALPRTGDGPPPGAAPRRRPGARAGALALGALCAVYLLLAALPAAPRSDLVLATEGGSPGWLLGPLRLAGAPGADGALAGPLFYAGLWLAWGLYAVVVARSAELPRRGALAAVVGLHALFLLAPPLLSQDVFSYIAYARMGTEHGLDPYTAAPLDIPGDPVFGFAGSKHASSVYGPVFTLLTYGLAPLGVAGAFWALKLVAVASSLGVVALVWRGAVRLGREPLAPALVVGLNPHVLVHVVSAAHNEALLALVTVGGVVAFIGGRPAGGAALAAAAAGIKASAALVVPFLVLGARRSRAAASPRAAWEGATPDGADGARGRPVLQAALAVAGVGAAIALLGLAVFGMHALDAFGVLGSNQGRTSRFSLPYKTAEVLGALLPGDRLDYRMPVRAVYAVAFTAGLAWLLLRTWRGADPVRMAGWATLAVLLASAWLVPWYLMWLLPLAALAFDRRLLVATLALSAWALAIAVPL